MAHIKINFQITISSDYHSGSGFGIGSLVDAGLLREFDGRPALRGTTIAGLLRDAAENLKQLPPIVEQDKQDKIVSDAIERIFGTAVIPKTWRLSSATTVGSGASHLERWGSQDVMRVRVNPRTGRSDPQKLFSQEEGQRGLEFRFSAECYNASKQEAKDALLLISAARLLRHLGSSRRRGRGACTVSLLSVTGLDFLDNSELLRSAIQQFSSIWLNNGAFEWETDNKPEHNESDETTLDEIPEKGGKTKLTFDCIVKLQEPTVISRRSETANTFQSLNYIPGGLVIGAFATRVAKVLGLAPGRTKQIDEVQSEFHSLFSRGRVSCSGLLPAKRFSGTQLLAASVFAPLDVFVCDIEPDFEPGNPSRHKNQAFSLTRKVPHKCDADNVCSAKLVDVSNSFILLDEKHKLTAFQPDFREEAHISIDRKTGRVDEGPFEYVALEAGQYFIGQLSFSDADAVRMFQKLTEVQLIEKEGSAEEKTDCEETYEIFLGKATRRGYGKAHFTLQNVQGSGPWIQQKIENRVPDNAGFEPGLRMTLLTDTIILDPLGRHYEDFTEEWLISILNSDYDAPHIKKEDIEIINQFARSREVDSFHGHRRMPRWRDKAIIAGSTVGFKLSREVISIINDFGERKNGVSAFQQKLLAIEKNGIGLRRHEGFGRAVFNHSIYNDDPKIKYQHYSIPKSWTKPSTFDQAANKVVFKRTWENILDEFEADSGWGIIDERYLVISRVIFMLRERDLTEIKNKLALFTQPGSAFLWNKQLQARENDKSIDTGIIYDKLDELAAEVQSSDYEHIRHDCLRIGLAMLSERIASQAKAAQ